MKPTAGEADIDRKPKVPKGKGDPPTELVVQDLIVGKGKRAQSGDTVSVRYVGVLFENGKEFDSSWKSGKGQTFQFPLGGGQVIPGWDQGVAGMREGGRRKLIIPPELAYGAQGFPPDIPPDAALIFDIDLVKASDEFRAGRPSVPDVHARDQAVPDRVDVLDRRVGEQLAGRVVHHLVDVDHDAAVGVGREALRLDP